MAKESVPKGGQQSKKSQQPTAVQKPAMESALEPAAMPVAPGAELLHHEQLSEQQRQVVAAQIGRLQGNNYLQRLLAAPAGTVQRRRLRRIAGRRLGQVTIAPPIQESETEEAETEEAEEESTTDVILAEAELVPAGVTARTFDGFATRLEAYGQAWASSRLCAVVEDQDGRFHAIRTNQTGQINQNRVSIVPSEHNFRRLWWVNLPGDREMASPQSWQERADRARGWSRIRQAAQIPADFQCPHGGQHDSERPSLAALRQCASEEFALLLADILSLSRNEIFVARTANQYDPDAMVSFDIFMTDAKAKQTGGFVLDRQTFAPAPTPPAIVIGPRAFDSTSYLYTLASAIHETVHFGHDVQNIDLFERWQRSPRGMTFRDWLSNQLRRRRITQEQYDLAVEALSGGAHNASEVLSYLTDFTFSYHRLPPTRRLDRYGSLSSLAVRWVRPSTSQEIKEICITHLGNYYRSLGPVHQRNLLAHARLAQGQDSRVFWETLIAEFQGTRRS